MTLRSPNDIWQNLIDRNPNKLSPGFKIYPGEFVKFLKSPEFSISSIKTATRIISSSRAPNELAFLFVCSHYSLTATSDYPLYLRWGDLESAAYILEEAIRAAKGKQNLNTFYHVKLSVIRARDPKSNLDGLMYNIERFHRILDFSKKIFEDLPNHEKIFLSEFKIGYESSWVADSRRLPSLAHVRKDIRADKTLKNLEKILTGAPPIPIPGPALTRFLCEMRRMDQVPWYPHLTAYTFWALKQGHKESYIENNLERVHDFLSYEYYFFDNGTYGIYPPYPFTKDHLDSIYTIAESLRKYRGFKDIFPNFEEFFPKISFEEIDSQVPSELMLEQLPPVKEGWKMLRSLIPEQDDSKEGKFITKILELVRKPSNQTIYSLHLEYVALSLLINRHHRPNSIYSIILSMIEIFKLIELRSDTNKPQVLNPAQIISLLEDSTFNSSKLRILARAYQSAVQSQSQLQNRYPKEVKELEHYFIPLLSRRPVFQTGSGTHSAEMRARLREQRGRIADNWITLHQLADLRYAAIRALTLAYREAILELNPKVVNQEIPLDVYIPGL
ncbi:hypothetical protein [Deinococcus humi]|uniref:Uncharacterized protein n=1 Tax=Deinococcus humi TaxID=662880 RepID=A0A7W8JWP5_9DEIO|nr:hypothetical protein [Deinococcus humi]MBB5364519.1 hypothetical protein [Deinococcus humi]GGO38009.1 hypothetical protein GCM10008949_43990 [Deinococcus humi]